MCVCVCVCVCACVMCVSFLLFTLQFQQQSEEPVPHRRGIRHENRSLADSEQRAVKRPRLMQSHSHSDPLQSKDWNEVPCFKQELLVHLSDVLQPNTDTIIYT